MIIDHLNLNHLRIFISVYRLKSMTMAAKELYLTQSGISQHMKSLEDVLETKLFDRIKQKLVPTAAADVLYNQCMKGLNQIEDALIQLKGGEKRLSGVVRIGITVEFGKNMILPLLSKFAVKNPMVDYKIRIGFASEMNQMLLNGDIDFAFIDEYTMDPRIHTQKVYDEMLGLYIHKDLLKKYEEKALTKKFFEGLNYIAYEDGGPILRKWFHYHLNTKHINLNIKMVVMDVEYIANLVISGVGAGILPGHHIAHLGKRVRGLHCFLVKKVPLKNSISLAHLRGKTFTNATQSLMDYLLEEIGKNASTKIFS